MLFNDVNRSEGGKNGSAKAETAINIAKTASAATGWGASGNARLRLISYVSLQRLRLRPKAFGSALTLRPNKSQSGVVPPSTHPKLAQLANAVSQTSTIFLIFGSGEKMYN